MPNWCNNTIEIKGKPSKIDEFEKFLDEGNGKDWFSYFHPIPDEEQANWYQWSIENWGTKWNADAQDWQRIDENTISFWFDTAWAPPIQFYDKLKSDGFLVNAKYHEEGMCFVGHYSDGDDDYYEYSDLESLEDIPEYLVEYWNLSEMLEERAEWDNEDDFNDEETENDKQI